MRHNNILPKQKTSIGQDIGKEQSMKKKNLLVQKLGSRCPSLQLSRTEFNNEFNDRKRGCQNPERIGTKRKKT